MRACEGCRRRKIKCDAATTNTWPCSACIRLKLHCVPPTVNYDRDFPPGSQSFEAESGQYETSGGDDDYQQQVAIQQHLAAQPKHGQPMYQTAIPYSNGVGVYQQMAPSMPYGEPQTSQQTLQYSSMPATVGPLDGQYQPQNVFPTPPMHQVQQSAPADSPESYSTDQYGQQDLADLLGELKMNEAGTGKKTTTRSFLSVRGTY
jgi:hypothetical protein